ncbi:hypothetical protein EJV47_08470 [Hymenobacter gummosus]|uniref:Uncharacterized protein n=1 Tax=Hymenobacter gummosus TaxID=1776032 RepID=A0A431U4W7_9BACT|nr:hypothetical protein [Hymenobacter gummosus]RTQ50658.1 hypothetical protein EJV47_08470 [Hymenobacter gummosus]
MLLPAAWLTMLLTTPPTPAAAPAADFWTAVPAAAQRKLGPPRLPPTRYRVLKLDLARARRFLKAVPAQGPAPTLFALPLPDGTKRPFRLERTQVMHPDLAAQFPDLLTFMGRDAQDALADVRLELTPTGLRAQIIGYGRTQFVEPYRAGDPLHYICFDKADLPPGSKQWQEAPPQR